MCNSDAEKCGRSPEEPALDDLQSNDQSDDGELSCPTPQPVRDEVWDAFELDEDTVEPQPEYGDFWGELDEDEAV